MSEWSIRLGRPMDAPFIVATWKRSVGRLLRGAEKGEAYLRAQERVICALLETSRVYVATSPADDDAIYGYVVGEPGRPSLIHFAYVKKCYRKGGVARSLVRRLLDGHDERKDGIAITEIGEPSLLRYIKARGWSIATRRAYYHALVSGERKVGT